jgi:hypothetical protein
VGLAREHFVALCTLGAIVPARDQPLAQLVPMRLHEVAGAPQKKVAYFALREDASR